MSDIVMLLLLENQNERNDNYYQKFLKNLRDTANPFLIPDLQFKKLYRLPKSIAQELFNELEAYVEIPQREDAIPFYLKCLMTFHFLGYGSYQKSIAANYLSAMSQSSTSRFITQVCELIVEKLLPQWVKFPTTNEEFRNLKEGFFTKHGCRGTIGAIDGTHVSIIAPLSNDNAHPPVVYMNRKSHHSINVMLICDSECKIIACDARYPGSVHDSAIFQLSDIRNFLKQNYEDNNDHTTHLIGDSGYALEPWLFTPIRNPAENSPESLFNIQHKSARNVIERTNGLLKARFRSLLHHRVLHYHPAKAGIIIYACIILHNILVHNKITDLIQEDDDDENIIYNDDDSEAETNDDIDQPPNNILELGSRTRAEYIRNNF